jgi:hypothetical protein
LENLAIELASSTEHNRDLEYTREIRRIVEYKQREKRRENSKWRRKGNLQTKRS